jgi:hypothetical protein
MITVNSAAVCHWVRFAERANQHRSARFAAVVSGAKASCLQIRCNQRDQECRESLRSLPSVCFAASESTPMSTFRSDLRAVDERRLQIWRDRI